MNAALQESSHPPQRVAEPTDLTRRLRPLIATIAFEESLRRLTNLAQSDKPTLAHHQLEQVLASLMLLPHSLRRLVWLTTFSSPTLVRRSSHTTGVHHWELGISRRWDAMETAGGAACLLGIVARAPSAGHEGLLFRLGESEAFTALLPRNDFNLIAAEAATLSATCNATECASIWEATKSLEMPSLRETCHLAAWLHALLSPESAQVAPTESDACVALCTASLLRGLRRSGARAHGCALGLALRNVRANQSSPAPVKVPTALEGCGRVAPLLAPLVVDCLIAAMAALEPSPDPRRRIKLILQRGPKLIDAARSATASLERMTTEQWLHRIMGVTETLNEHSRTQDEEAA